MSFEELKFRYPQLPSHSNNMSLQLEQLGEEEEEEEEGRRRRIVLQCNMIVVEMNFESRQVPKLDLDLHLDSSSSVT